MSFEYLDLAAMDHSTGFHVIMGFRSKSISFLQKSFTGSIWPTCELCPLYSTSTGFFSCPFTHSCLSLLQLPASALWFTNLPTRTKLSSSNKKQTPTPTKSFFVTLFSPWFLSPSTVVHDLLWYLCWCPDCKRLLRHLTSTFHFIQYNYLYTYTRWHKLCYLSLEWWWILCEQCFTK